MKRSQERTDYLNRLAQAARDVKNGEDVANSGYLARKPLQRLISAVGFITDERIKVDQRRRKQTQNAYFGATPDDAVDMGWEGR